MRSHIHLMRLAMIVIGTWVPPAAAAASAEQVRQAEVVRPSGAYALAMLRIDGVSNGVMVPFRDGVGRVSHPAGITRDGGRLLRNGDRLTGSFDVPLPLKEKKAPTRYTQAKCELAVAGGKITGTCVVGDVSYTVTGTWQTEAELAGVNPLNPDAVWPMWGGPVNGGTCATATGGQLVDTLDKARLVWRSEAAIGNNMGSINRFMRDLASATAIRTSGQSASPVYGDGIIFLHQRVPAGEELELTNGDNAGGGTTAEEIKAAGFDELPWYAKEKYQLRANEQVVAMDAVTGKTLWINTLPIGAPNIQHHKDRGGDRTPAYANGKLLALSYNGALFCLDAKTGQLLWQNEPQGKVFNPALAVAGDVVMAPARAEGEKARGVTWGAHDIATGKLLWRAPQRYSSSSVTVIQREGKHFVLVPASDKELSVGSVEDPVTLHCIEANTGRTAWSMPFLMGSNRLGIAATKDLMVTFERKPGHEAGDDERGQKYLAGLVCGYRLHDDKAERLWAVDFDLVRDSLPLIMHDRYVVAIGSGYSQSEDLHKVIDAATGKVISHTTGLGPQNGGYNQAMADLTLVRRDGTHGRIEFIVYQVDQQGQIKQLPPEQWSPPGPHTTSYHHPTMYPLLDGRMYVRQADGIYCYDLRKQGGTK